MFGPLQQYQKHYANDAEELERSFQTKVHSDKYMNVNDVNVSDEDDFLSRCMMIKAKNIVMKERTWIDRVAQREHQRDVTNVKRSGEWLNMKSRNLVPGDLVKLTLGFLIPADCVGREIDLCGHVPDDWRVSAGYFEKRRQAQQCVEWSV